MKVIVVKEKLKKNGKKIEYKLNSFIEWIIYAFGYAVVLWLTSNLFKSLYIDSFLTGLIAAFIICFINKTIKPVLVTLSLPIIGVTLGLFYFVINLGILLLVDLILLQHFDLTGVFSTIFVSLFISFFNMMLEGIVIKPIIERCKK